MTYHLDLLFLDFPIFSEPGPRRQIARVFVKTRTGAHYQGINDLDYITPECVALGEFEANLDLLQAEIEAIRKKARRKFATAKPAPN
jgi:hypothetical protein